MTRVPRAAVVDARAALATRLVAAATAPYRDAGPFAYWFARGKLSRDPLFMTLLERAAIPDASRLVDLGCGQGLLASWLKAAEQVHQDADPAAWPARWAPPPKVASSFGIDRSRAEVERARRALAEPTAVHRADLAVVDAEVIGPCDVVTLFDVLHYLQPDAQERLLRVVRDCLEPRGTLLLRVGDASRLAASRWSAAVDVVVSLGRGHPGRLHRRSLHDWTTLLARAGFAVDVLHDEPAGRTASFANVLLRATVTPSRPSAAAGSL